MEPLELLRQRMTAPDAREELVRQYRELQDLAAEAQAKQPKAKPSSIWEGVKNTGRGLAAKAGEFYDDASMPQDVAQQQLKDYVARFGQHLAGVLPRTFEAADRLGNRTATPEDAGMLLNAAMLGTSGGMFGAPARAGEMVLGAGRVRKTPVRGVLTEADFAPAAAPAVEKRLQVGGNNPPAEFKFPQYAADYPPVGPPSLQFDPIKKKEFLGKEPTAEAIAFEKERNKIRKDMTKSGYVPFFDPAQRFDVDPANYPANLDTTTVVPKKQVTTDEYLQGAPAVYDVNDPAKIKKKAKSALDSDEVRGRLQEAYQRGSGMPNTRNWYFMGQLEKAFIDELGETKGREEFQKKFAVPMAGTTGGADPTANLLMAQYGNYLRENKLPLPEASHQYPFPIGGQYAKTNMKTYMDIMDAGGFQALAAANPKRHNFSQNFTGNKNAATMDEQMTSGMTPGLQVPPTGTYGLYEKILAEEAAKAGVSPREFQEVGWAGFKNMKDPKYTSGKPMIEHVNEAIERTHRLTGMPKDEIVKQAFIYGKIPLYGLGGVVAGKAATDQLRER